MNENETLKIGIQNKEFWNNDVFLFVEIKTLVQMKTVIFFVWKFVGVIWGKRVWMIAMVY